MDHAEVIRRLESAPYGSDELLDAVEAALDSGNGLLVYLDRSAAKYKQQEEQDALEFRRLQCYLSGKRFRIGQRVPPVERFHERARLLFGGPRQASPAKVDEE